MDEKHEQQIKQIMSEMDCDRGFACYESGFENLCSVKLIAGGAVLECLGEGCPRQYLAQCPFRMSFGFSYVCNCPLRAYVAKHLGK